MSKKKTKNKMDPQTDIYMSDYFLLHPKHNVQGIGGATLTSSNTLFLDLRQF